MKIKIRKISVLVLIGMLVGTGLVGMIPTVAAGTENLPYKDDFEDMNNNGWSVESGDWNVLTSGYYYQSDDGIYGGHTPYEYEKISVLETPPPTDDYIIQVRMKQLDLEGSSGFVFRYTDWLNYYYILLWSGFWLGEHRNYFEFWTQVDGTWENPIWTIVNAVSTDWNTITADIRGDNFDFYLNGDLVIRTTDSQLTSGNVGLITETARAYFDDWSVGIPVYTPQSAFPGEQIEVDLYPVPLEEVSVVFSEVGGAGESTLIASGTNLGPDLYNFYLSIVGTYYGISTTAVYTGPVTVCINYDDAGLSEFQEESINIYHWQGNKWVDVTVSRDPVGNIIFGEVSFLYPLRRTEPPLVMTPGGLDDNPPYYDGFEVPDGPATDWREQTPSDSEWEVSGYEYHQTNTWSSMGQYRFDHIAYIDPILMPSPSEDYRIQVKTKLIDYEQYYHLYSYGLVFRYQSDQNYYTIQLIQDYPHEPFFYELMLEFRPFINGVWGPRYIAGVSIDDPNFNLLEWHTITADIRGNKFDFYLDKSCVFQVTDDELTWGTVGLYTEGAHAHFDDWTAGFPEDTSPGLPGDPVLVNPYPDVSVVFDNVEVSGETTAIPSAEYPGPDLGNFYIEGVGNFYDISTTAQYNGIITVGLPYPVPLPGGVLPSDLRIHHWQGNDWVELPPVEVDTVNHKIYCEVSSLSWFVVAYSLIDPPVVTITGPASGSVYPIDTSVPFTASFIDTDEGDTHAASWEFESGGNIISVPGTVIAGEGGGTVEDDISFSTVGVYTVTLTVTDDYGLQGTATTVEGLPAMVVIYDPSAGFVTGGGWIDSPAGAYRGDEGLTGKASFGFVAKYKKGAQVPTGQIEFKFKVADLNFHSSSYQWLVITGAKAKFKGTGTINGGGEYNFKLWATDGALLGGGGEDKFRIKIWQEDSDGNEVVVYDNGMETPLGGGQIVIHKG